jgi:hypothetical protein
MTEVPHSRARVVVQAQGCFREPRRMSALFCRAVCARQRRTTCGCCTGKARPKRKQSQWRRPRAGRRAASGPAAAEVADRATDRPTRARRRSGHGCRYRLRVDKIGVITFTTAERTAARAPEAAASPDPSFLAPFCTAMARSHLRSSSARTESCLRRRAITQRRLQLRELTKGGLAKVFWSRQR